MSTKNTQADTIPENATEGRPEIVSTSINVRKVVWDDLKIAAIRSGLTFGQAVEEALKSWADERNRESTAHRT